MGNSSTKEQRPPPSHLHASTGFRRHGSGPPSPGAGTSSVSRSSDRHGSNPHHGLGRRSSRPELSFLGLGGGVDSDSAGIELRRETRQEREARRAERERVAREKERVRSMRDESVDGGYLVTQGVYTGTEDFSKPIVRQLMIERRIAPFFRGLNDHRSSWKDNQVIAAARGMPVPPPDESSPGDGAAMPGSPPVESSPPLGAVANGLAIPAATGSKAQTTEPSSTSSPPAAPAAPGPSPSSLGLSAPSPSPFRPRSKTAATLASLSKAPHAGDMTPYEMHLPAEPLVDGRAIETVLYREVSECPICFLYYPPFLNRTRCCDQPICSECFVQIKRPDPHPPEHGEPAVPTATTSPDPATQADSALVSEPAACPFCVQPEFGITYEPPPFRRGLTYANQAQAQPLVRSGSGMSSSSSLSSTSGPSAGLVPMPAGANRRRTTSLSVNDANVITTDRIRPDWTQKLASAKAQQARRAAAATALHTAAYLMGNGAGSESRGFGAFGRRHRLTSRTPQDEGSHGGGGTAVSLGNMSALVAMADRHGLSTGRAERQGERPTGESSSRRSRMDDLEEMMMMEAIRLSLASEEERRRKEDKKAEKEAKKKNKKEAKRDGRSGGSDDQATADESAGLGPGTTVQSSNEAASDKGKSVDRARSVSAQAEASVKRTRSRDALSPPAHAASEVRRPSNLRQVSNNSSAASSTAGPFAAVAPSKRDLNGSDSSFDVSPDEAGGKAASSGEGRASPASVDDGNATDSLFNFQSLAAMIGKEQPWMEAEHLEDPGEDHGLEAQPAEAAAAAITSMSTTPFNDASPHVHTA